MTALKFDKFMLEFLRLAMHKDNTSRSSCKRNGSTRVADETRSSPRPRAWVPCTCHSSSARVRLHEDVLAGVAVDEADGVLALVVVVGAGTLVVRVDDVGVDATAAPIVDADAGALVAVVLGVVVHALAVGFAFAGGA